MNKSIITISILAAIILSGCGKDRPEDSKTLRSLYKDFKNGEICKCHLNGENVYLGGLNAHDAGATVFDADGNTLGGCNYAYRAVDSICSKLEDCEVIYRVENNIWGLPAVDLYGLGK